MEKVYIRTFGCQMNKYDSGVMAGCLRKDGYAPVDDEKSADVVLLNTCSVRKHAEQRVEGMLGHLKHLRKTKPALIIGVCGCMAQKEGKELVRKFPQVDLVCGTHHFARVSILLRRVLENGSRVIEIGQKARGSEEVGCLSLAQRDEGKKTPVCAYVSVMRGCDSFCSYCVVPYLRGRERSRAAGEILEEIKLLAEKGTREVILLGQNIVRYGRGLEESADFAGLLDEVNAVDGIQRIRFLTSHPADFSDRIIEKAASCGKVCESFHLPLQAGSDKVLGLMKRRYDSQYYFGLIEKLRDAVPGAAITTDLIAGFPGETEEDFSKTREMVEKIGFDDAFIYKYSDRPGTKAFSMEGKVAESVKTERLEELLGLQRKITLDKNSCLKGAKVDVLVEGVSKKDVSYMYGQTGTGKNVVFEGSEELSGRVVTVEIIKTGVATLAGRVVRG